MIDLVNANLCRLCSDDVINGTPIFEPYNNEVPLAETINHYLPVQVADDGKLPRFVCPGCHLQIEATSEFFKLLLAGQRRLRDLLKEEIERKLREVRDEAKKRLEEELSTIQPADVDIQSILYPTDHPLSLATEGREFPKRKRGRPRKPKPPENVSSDTNPPAEELGLSNEENVDPVEADSVNSKDVTANLEPEETGPGRRRRKAPQKFASLVQGKELDKILQEEGVVDEEDLMEEDNIEDQDVQINHSEPEDDEEVEEDDEEVDGTGDGVAFNASGRRKTRRRKKAKYTCEFCGKLFRTEVRFEKHKYKSYLFTELANVSVLGLNLFSGYLLFIYYTNTFRRKLHGESLAVCQQCNTVFEGREELLVHQTMEGHLESVLSETNPNSMPDLENTECEALSNTDILGVASGTSFKCHKCSTTFSGKIALLKHIYESHSARKRHICTICGKEFRVRQALQRHSVVHTGERPFACKICGLTFKTQANLHTHKNVHSGARRFVCEICGLGLSHSTGLKLHMRWHAGEKPHVCGFCGKAFTQKGNLEEHERTHTGERPFMCEFCSRSFVTSSQLKLHLRRHTGEKPYKCQHCGKDFLHKASYDAHIRRHDGVKPFACTRCPKSFVEAAALKRHLRFHTGEKPYSCLVCGKNFSDKSNLMKHRKAHKEVNDGVTFEYSDANAAPADQDLARVIYVTLQEEEANDTPERNSMEADDFNANLAAINQDSATFSFSADEAALAEAVSSQDFPETDLPLSEALDSLSNVDLELGSAPGENLTGGANEEGQKTIQFTTQDGETVCWVLPAGVDPMQFASEYLSQLQSEAAIAPEQES